MLRKKISLALITALMVSSVAVTAFAKTPGSTPGEAAYTHLVELSDGIGQRVAGTEGEGKAREYIVKAFKEMGYTATFQDFTYARKGKSYSSANVIAEKPGASKKQIIVGGHYDSVNVGRGADDNASSIGVILEVAKWLKEVNAPYSIKFITYGAEEVGLKGSAYYVSQMSREEIDNTVMIVNLDSLIAGDKMYAYGGEDKDGWFRNKAMQIAKRLNLSLQTNPGLNPEYPAGTTGDWSDHAPFKAVGIPYIYFEATNWELGDLDGYTQTVKDGEIWHTEKDTIEYIKANYPGRIEERLSTFVQVLEDLLKTSRNNVSQ